MKNASPLPTTQFRSEERRVGKEGVGTCSTRWWSEHKTAYELRISDWSSDVCSSDLLRARTLGVGGRQALRRRRYLGIPRVSIRAQEGRVDSSRGPAIRWADQSRC